MFESRDHLPPDTSARGLADEFLFFSGCRNRPVARSIRSAILLAAEHLAETTGPLTWTELEGEALFARIRHLDIHQQEGVALHLIGFYGWMVSEGRITLGGGLDVIDALRNAAPPSPVLDELWQRAQRTLPSIAPN